MLYKELQKIASCNPELASHVASIMEALSVKTGGMSRGALVDLRAIFDLMDGNIAHSLGMLSKSKHDFKRQIADLKRMRPKFKKFKDTGALMADRVVSGKPDPKTTEKALKEGQQLLRVMLELEKVGRTWNLNEDLEPDPEGEYASIIEGSAPDMNWVVESGIKELRDKLPREVKQLEMEEERKKREEERRKEEEKTRPYQTVEYRLKTILKRLDAYGGRYVEVYSDLEGSHPSISGSYRSDLPKETMDQSWDIVEDEIERASKLLKGLEDEPVVESVSVDLGDKNYVEVWIKLKKP